MKQSIAQYCMGLSRRKRRVVAVTAIPLLLGVAWMLTIGPLLMLYASQDSWRTHAVTVVSQSRGSEPYLKLVDQQLESLPQSPLWSQFYAVDKEGMASATLQADVGRLVGSAHGAVQSLTPLPTVAAGMTSKIGLRVVVTMTIDQLKDFLSSTASHARFLRVERLSVLAPSAQMPSQNPLLTVTMDIFGMEWVRSDVSKAINTVSAVEQ